MSRFCSKTCPRRRRGKRQAENEDSSKQREARKQADADTLQFQELSTELARAAEDMAKLEDESRARVKIDEERSDLEKQKQAMQEQMMELEEKIRANDRKRDAMDTQATEDQESSKRQRK